FPGPLPPFVYPASVNFEDQGRFHEPAPLACRTGSAAASALSAGTGPPAFPPPAAGVRQCQRRAQRPGLRLAGPGPAGSQRRGTPQPVGAPARPCRPGLAGTTRPAPALLGPPRLSGAARRAGGRATAAVRGG